uniref:Ankyrin repeat protein n=1 Tax=viral metagenome TaxID=1070528 RepID=A0A6C0AFF1_9ZZZZ
MQEIKIKNIPDYLKNSPFYNNLDISDEESLVCVFIHNGIINDSKDFLEVSKVLGFWCSNQITSEMYEFIVNNFYIWRKEIIGLLHYNIKLSLFKDILKIKTLCELYGYAVKKDNVILYEEFYKIRYKYFREQDICYNFKKKKKFNNYNYLTFEKILNNQNIYFCNVSATGSFNCLKFLFENEENKKNFEWALYHAYINNRLQCFKFLFENGVKFPISSVLINKNKNSCDEYLRINNYVLEY